MTLLKVRTKPGSLSKKRSRITLKGVVQGVGFRPFVYRLATELELVGWVRNFPQGVLIEVEGTRGRIEDFLLRLETEKPNLSSILNLEYSFLTPVGYKAFTIQSSEGGGKKEALVLPDMATCSDCLNEIFDPANRRFAYPFTNCTHCGPRFSIIESLPYDRVRTTMKRFILCEDCQREYEDPEDRRFHAEPTACPYCGPHLERWDAKGRAMATHEAALKDTAEAIRKGSIVAVKGLGGFQLLVDARDPSPVERLRKRKQRDEKPFAVMHPTMESIRACCDVSGLEEQLLLSPESPIVLLRSKGCSNKAIAPNNPNLGVMLPYTPLHHLLMRELGFPVIATSGNLAGEPICIDEREAIVRLAGIADSFLVHNRPIARHVDDSVVRVILGGQQVLRRARGYAPLPLHLPNPVRPILAVGAHLKNTIAVSTNQNIFISQHIGDLDNPEAFQAFRNVIQDLQTFYAIQPHAVVRDAHPDYLSSRFADTSEKEVVTVQHHTAHVLACMAENNLQEPVLGVSWDGTGYGTDGTVWGGEFFDVTEETIDRVAHFKPFPLPGGEAAVREPRRSALGLLIEMGEDDLIKDLPCARAFNRQALQLLKRAAEKGVHTPFTSSAGRLFDGIASILGLRQVTSFEGQAAMELEFAAQGYKINEHYGFEILSHTDKPLILDWRSMLKAIIKDSRRGLSLGMISAKCHHTLVAMILHVAKAAGRECVVLTGGCFQNRRLTEQTVHRLKEEGFHPYWHQRIPPNDGGIAVGQIMAATRQMRKDRIKVCA